MPALQEIFKAPLQKDDLLSDSLQTVLTNVQGNILQIHGHNFAAHIFLRFQAGKQIEVKKWLRDYIAGSRPPAVVMSAQDQLRERKLYPKSQDRPALFMSCLLSACGYAYLGWPTTQFSEAFHSGMKQRATDRLHDIPPTAWEDNYQHPIHTLIILAHRDPDILQTATQTIVTQVQQFDTYCWVEDGHVLREGEGTEGIRKEHFGFVDAHSQPLFFQEDLDEEERKRGIDRWNPGAGPHLVLTRDPLSDEETDYGSYLVFRKLEQDVDGFTTQLRKLANALQKDEEDAAALVVGRYRDGRPLIPPTTPPAPPGLSKPVIPNNFRYDTDWNGQHCPFHAHMRRMNPRWETNSAEYDRRIARRSIPYGEPGTKPVGLLFMCYQQSLESQFEALQGEWAYTPKALPPSGYDGLIGHKLEQSPTDVPQWHIPLQTTEAFIGDCVTLKGGEYFFAPSLSVLYSRL